MFRFLRGRSADDETVTPARLEPPTGPVPVSRFASLAELYPLGAPLRLFPEFESEVQLDSLLLGYRIDGHELFAPGDYRLQADNGAPARLMIGEARLDKLQSLEFLIPYDRSEQARIDYVSRAELDRLGHFAPGNRFTLIGATVDRQTPYLLSEVRRVEHLDSGVYQNHSVAVLRVFPDTLEFHDQRRYYRIETAQPAELRAATGGRAHACTLVDFSETATQILLDKEDEDVAALRDGRRVILALDIHGSGQRFTLGGRVLRRAGRRLVLRLETLQQGETFVTLTTLSVLAIKAALLKAPPDPDCLTGFDPLSADTEPDDGG
ncbi:PilZ domain-containing protein [Thiohalobacter sp.]|uniref:PilZ domain-containing protein n=1 Tax=Thiohalobacter sp. TaxID=2025948 RepID=UPI002633AFBB|nr:PilZ domain-containing protein [Thiohalobacter sp.]